MVDCCTYSWDQLVYVPNSPFRTKAAISLVAAGLGSSSASRGTQGVRVHTTTQLCVLAVLKVSKSRKTIVIFRVFLTAPVNYRPNANTRSHRSSRVALSDISHYDRCHGIAFATLPDT